MNELVVIVSSFNRAALLKEALRSLTEALSSQPAAIFVTDAGSQDGSQNLVHELRSQSRLPISLLEEEGISFAAGVNQAAARALSDFPAARYLLLFETDNFLQDDTPIRSAIALLESEPALAAAGFTTRKHDGSPAGFGCRFPCPLHFALGPQLCHWLKLDAPHLAWKNTPIGRWSFCDVVYTSPLVIRRAAWEQTAGLAAEKFPFSDCDLDWALRLRSLGWRQAVLQSDAVIHDNQAQLSAWSAARARQFHRARLELLRPQARSCAWMKPALRLRHACELVAAAALARRRALAARWALLRSVGSEYR